MDRSDTWNDAWLGRLVGLAALPALYVVSRYNYLLFHTLVELFGIVVAYAVFVLAWNSRRFLDNNYLLSLGIAFPFVAILHLVHTLGYKGMGVFPSHDPYIATQLWIVARFSLAAAFLLAPVFLGRRVNINIMFAGWLAGTAFLLLAVFRWDLVPPMFIEGKGLTPFKKTCEHVISAMMVVSLVPLYLKRDHFAPNVFRIMVAAVLTAFAAELPFTSYSNIYGYMNALGHMLSVLCFYLVYRALIVTGVRNPHELLFRNLKQSEEAMRESEARLKLALDAGAMGTSDWVIGTDQVEWSDGYYTLLGYRLGEVQPSRQAFLSRIHPDDREQQARVVRDAMERMTEYTCEFRVIWPDGSVHWVENRGRYVYDASGRPVRHYGVVMAITLRKQIEAERQNLLEAERAARTESERLNRMKDEFLATVSHELRSPLSAIVGWARLLAGGKVETAKAADIIRRSAGSLTQIVEDLLNMSRIISGKIRLQREPVNLIEILANVVESVQFTADAKSIHMDVSYDPELAPLDCDPGRIQQIVWNLLTNAIKFTPQGGRVIMGVSQSRTHVAIKVQDTGKGIAPEFLPHVFERFRQEDGGIARHHGGLGLGLAIVKNLVELHGGSIEVESEGEGRGATFVVMLPRVAPPADASELPTQPPIAGGTPVGLDEGTLQAIKVLSVDDDTYSRELLARVLSDAGATVRTAASPREAFALLGEFRPDVLISDVGMPGEDGYTFIRSLRASENGQARIPCIAVTALSRPEDRERALAVGFDEHVGKPFDPGTLCMLVARLVRERTSPANIVTPARESAGESRPPHVLLVEDESCTAAMLKIILEGEGYRVSIADSAAKAARLAEAEPVDLVVSDLVLEDGMGWDLLGKLPGGRAVPGIIMSGYSESEYIEKSKAAGFSEYLVKPVDADELVAAIARVLERQSRIPNH